LLIHYALRSTTSFLIQRGQAELTRFYISFTIHSLLLTIHLQQTASGCVRLDHGKIKPILAYETFQEQDHSFYSILIIALLFFGCGGPVKRKIKIMQRQVPYPRDTVRMKNILLIRRKVF
jgi:hypothetical protein